MSNMDYTKYAKINNEVVEKVDEIPVEAVKPVGENPVAEPEVEPAVEPEAEPVAEPEAEPEVEHKIGRVANCAKLNVRKAPDPKADIVCELFCYTEVEINNEESTDDFYKVCTASGVEGFCMKSYILEK